MILDGIPAGADPQRGPASPSVPTACCTWPPATRRTGRPRQDQESLAGKILRVTPDGDVPDDNPIDGSPVWSLGHRNVQGLAFDARRPAVRARVRSRPRRRGQPRSKPGANHGWPEVTGEAGVDGFADPVLVRQPPDASWSGGAVLTGGAIPQWEGDLFVARCAASGCTASRSRTVEVAGEPEELYVGELGRLRDVTQAPGRFALAADQQPRRPRVPARRATTGSSASDHPRLSSGTRRQHDRPRATVPDVPFRGGPAGTEGCVRGAPEHAVLRSWVWAIVLGTLTLVLWLVYRRRYRRIGPDEALIVYGRKARKDRDGFRVIVGGGTFVTPFIEEADTFPLHAMQLDVQLRGVLAGDQRTPDQRQRHRDREGPRHARGTRAGLPDRPAGHLELPRHVGQRDPRRADQGGLRPPAHHRRGPVGRRPLHRPGPLHRGPEDEGRAVSSSRSATRSCRSCSSRSPTRTATSTLSVSPRSSAPAATRASRRPTTTATPRSQEEDARLEKERRRLSVEAEVADSEKDLSLRKAEIKEEVDVANARALKAGEMEAKLQDIQIAEREAERERRELDATVRERAEASKFAGRPRGRGRPVPRRAGGRGGEAAPRPARRGHRRRGGGREAASRRRSRRPSSSRPGRRRPRLRETGEAEAAAIRARGEAEAEARRKLAEALQAYSEAGPVARGAQGPARRRVGAASEPLSRAGRTTIISNGSDGGGTGASKLTADAIEVLTSTLPVVKDLSGVDLAALLQRVTSQDGRGGVDDGDDPGGADPCRSRGRRARHPVAPSPRIDGAGARSSPPGRARSVADARRPTRARPGARRARRSGGRRPASRPAVAAACPRSELTELARAVLSLERSQLDAMATGLADPDERLRLLAAAAGEVEELVVGEDLPQVEDAPSTAAPRGRATPLPPPAVAAGGPPADPTTAPPPSSRSRPRDSSRTATPPRRATHRANVSPTSSDLPLRSRRRSRIPYRCRFRCGCRRPSPSRNRRPRRSRDRQRRQLRRPGHRRTISRRCSTSSTSSRPPASGCSWWHASRVVRSAARTSCAS